MQSGLSKLCSGKLPSKTERKLLARTHPAYFAWLYLRADDGAPMKPTPFHLEWYELFRQQLMGQIRHVCLVAPKSHAKSTIYSKVAPLYVTCVDGIPWAKAKHGPNVRLINGAVNSELAERFLRANRRELESNELLIEDFGPFKPEEPEKWTQTELIVRRTATGASPTWRAVGTEGAVQGGRADWLFGDDLADLENMRSQLQRDRTQEWIDGDYMGTLEPDGHAGFIGTPKHNDDTYARAEARSKEPGSGWVFRRYDAIVDEPHKRTLWPARWSWDALMAKKASIGSLTFNRDYRCVAVNDETALFRMDLLRKALRPDLVFAESYAGPDVVTAAIDLAIVENERDAQRTDSDYTVLEVWQKQASGKRRLLWGERRRGLGMTPQITLAETTLRRYPALKIAIVEANQAQRWFASALLSTSRGELPIKPHVTGRGAHVDPYEGVPSLTALFEQEMIELPYGDERSRAFVDVLINELHGLGVETHDDTVMAMWLNEIGVRKLNTGVTWGSVTLRR